VNARLLNVATPLTAATVVVPLTPPGAELMVIEALDPVTTFPDPSWTCTTTLAMGVPDVPFTGCVVNTSFVAGPIPEVT
jgi:hypothetical protein